MKTVTLDILDIKAIDLLKDLEALNIIRIQDTENAPSINSFTKYKGKMSRQSIEEIDKQIDDLRNELD